MTKNKKGNKEFAKKFVVQSGKISAMIIKVLLVAGFSTIDQILSPHYVQRINYKKLWNEPLFDFSAEFKTPIQILKRKSIYAGLYRLKKQGLVSNSQDNWSLTKEGKDFTQSFFKLHSKYSKTKLSETDDIKRIVIFDIPEKNREKRNWIRGELIYHEYKPLQKSVWIGHRPLLPQFIENIEFLDLSEHVHIFSIKDEGTI